MSATDYATLAPDYARLIGYRLQALAAVSLAPIAEQARSGLRASLAAVGYWLDRLGPTGELGAGVVAGDVEAWRWVRVANQQGLAIEDVMRQCSDELVFARAWSEIVEPTAAGVAETASAAAGAIRPTVSLLVLGVVAYAVVQVARLWR